MMNWRYPDKPIETSPEEAARLTEAEWMVQCKYDGYNLTVIVDPDIRCMSRKNRPMSEVPAARFSPMIVDQLSSLDLPDGTILGTELMGPRGDHEPGVFIFDCYAYEGEWLSMTPYEDRWEQFCCPLALKLEQLPNIHMAETRDSGFLDFFRQLKNEWDGVTLSEAEGIVLKRRSGTLLLNLTSSKKNRSQLKVKFRDIRDRRW